MSGLASAATIARVALTLPAGTPNAEHGRWQRRLESALGGVTLSPSGMPPSAILIVRRLTDPAPGLLLEGEPWQGAARWGRALQPTLQELWRAAERPIHGPISAGAPAVWFADEAEWLAALTLDLHSGNAGQRWWWQSWLVRRSSAEQTVTALWLEEARSLPAALALLHQRLGKGLSGLAASLDRASIRELRAALATTYTLPRAFDTLAVNAPQLMPLIADGSRAGIAPFSAEDTTPAGVFVTAALALHHAPAALRRLLCTTGESNIAHNGTEASAVDGHSPVGTLPASRATEAPNPLPHPAGTPNATPSHEGSPSQLPALYESAPSQEPVHKASPLTTEEVLAAQPKQPAIPVGRSVDPEQAAAVTPEPAERDVDKPPSGLAATAGAATSPAPTAAAPSPTTTETSAIESAQLWAQAVDGIHTELGGAWYLVNVIEALDLWQQAPAGMDAWHLLAELAERLLGGRPPDPLWALLDELAAGAEVSEQHAAWPMWLDDTTSRVTSWLATQLTPAALPAAESDPITAMMQRPARLWVTRTHIDISFGLDQIDLRARLVGVDSDPGWVPALGRVVTFHFV